jgi:hypothetical protein
MLIIMLTHRRGELIFAVRKKASSLFKLSLDPTLSLILCHWLSLWIRKVRVVLMSTSLPPPAAPRMLGTKPESGRRSIAMMEAL